MTKPLTRREFLDLAARQSVAASAAASFLLASCRSDGDAAAALGLDRPATHDLIALLDEIIPASDNMPAASEAGTLPYFELLAASVPNVTETVNQSLSAVGTLAADRHGKRFAALSRDRSGEVVTAFAESSPDLFGALRTYVYEGYYLQPRVWKLLGYEPYPADRPGPSMTPFDPTTLDRVRSMPRLWREA